MTAISSPTDRQIPESLRLLRSDEVAAMLGIDPRSVRRMARAGRLPLVDLGHRTVRFRLTDVLAFVEASTTHESPAGQNGALEKERDDGAHLTP